MQFTSARPLIEKFRTGTFREEEVGPYFILYVLGVAMAPLLVSGHKTAWDTPENIAHIAITLLGVLYLRKQNKDTFGNGFLSKFFTLGWVIGIRLLLCAYPAVVVLSALASIVGGDHAIAPAATILLIAFDVIFYWWLGKLFAACHPAPSGQATAPNS